ncbi:hypothetical protein ACT3HK_11825 [Thermolongibacillus altinsuensis]
MEAKQIIQKDDAYYQIYGEKYIQKIDYLRKLITEDETGEDKFKVVNFEAGLGKSRYTDIIIREYLNEWNLDRKFLIVKRFNDESERSAQAIQDGSFLRDHVLVITADNWQKWKKDVKELQQKQVIIISHKRYIDLCENDVERAIFTKDRHTLIIDEKINFPVYTYSDEFYGEIRKYISRPNRKLFDEACKNLNDILDEYNNTTACVRVYPVIDKELFQQFTQMMTDEIKGTKDRERKLELKKFLNTVSLCYDKSILAILNSEKICTLNRKHTHWGLKNNIILDASAAIDGVYVANPNKYYIRKQTRLIDHSDSEFYHVKMKTSKSAIGANKKKYFKKIIEMLQERHVEGEKTLLVIHKKLADELYTYMQKTFGEDVWKDKDKETDPEYKNQSYAISWFGNLIGKNTFADFDNVWVLGTPNIPLNHYLIHYMQYAQTTLGKNQLKVYEGKFVNPKFRAIQDGYIAAEIYQSIKRIQRNPKPRGKFYIVINDEKIVHKVFGQMRNAKLTDTIEVKEEQKEKSTNKQPIKIDKVADYMLQLIENGEKKIEKSLIREQYRSIRFSELEKHPKIQPLIKSGKIKKQYRYYVIS